MILYSAKPLSKTFSAASFSHTNGMRTVSQPPSPSSRHRCLGDIPMELFYILSWILSGEQFANLSLAPPLALSLSLWFNQSGIFKDTENSKIWNMVVFIYVQRLFLIMANFYSMLARKCVCRHGTKI